MSDLYLPNQPGSQPQSQSGITTPRQIMAARTARQEARRAQQQTQEVDPLRRRQQEDVVGVGPDARRQQPQQSTRYNYSQAEQAARLPAGQNVTIGGRSDIIPPTSNGQVPRPGNTVVNQGQPRAVAGQQSYIPPQSQLPPTLQAGHASTDADRIQRNRTEALANLEMPPATAGVRPQLPQEYNPQSEELATRGAPFPHAFERWETLSSHWEGLTGYWIRRLQENTNELDGKPIDKQMARQITDLSAAGANLFHAVVELQRLRASSERKFQRWFVDQRAVQEQAQEQIGQLQEQLRQEQMRKPDISNVGNESLRAEKAKAEELVREMRRELSISKEEARRAWEELGRREQEERERTIALRSGEPTLIGGVQVLPMQGLSSRHNTTASQRPVTRDGPYQGGPSATMMGGQQAVSRSQTSLDSPSAEQHQFSYHPNATSPTDTDPFTETAPREPPVPLRHEPDTHFISTGSPQARQPVAQAIAAARATASPAHSHRSANPRSEGHQYVPSSRSHAASVQSEEEYHVGPDGQYIRDREGHPIPYRHPLVEENYISDDEDQYESSHQDRLQNERLHAQYAQRPSTSQRISPNPSNLTPSRSPASYHQSAYQQTTTPQVRQSPFQDVTPQSQHTTSTLSPVTPQQAMTARMSSPAREPANYEGTGYGEDENIYPQTTAPGNTASPATGAQTHHVPTRLSDIPEERTEASRSSAISFSPTRESEYTQGGIFGNRR